MNYLAPRQRTSDGRWDFTTKNDDRVFPVGYCSGPRDWKPEHFPILGGEFAARAAYELNVVQLAHPHFHSDGHATRDEAAACYRRYLLDTRTSFPPPHAPSLPCLVCKEPTDLSADVDGDRYPLCEKHLDRTSLEAVVPVADFIASS